MILKDELYKTNRKKQSLRLIDLVIYILLENEFEKISRNGRRS